ncbi:unnamed protein product [Amoebophrya sp. A120]|nr:unnamed protein product [Amoebophrya sp. A120]|eukprot:GSA120T00019609001.1
MSSKKWDFKLESSSNVLVAQEKSTALDKIDPSLGWKADDSTISTVTGQPKKAAVDKTFLDRKAWEAVMQPCQAVFMNMFMLWMMGSNPGIFGIMMLAYAYSSGIAQLKNVNNVFLPFSQQGVDCSFQKIAYVVICVAVLGYLTYSASGMGLLPTQTGDWISKIPYVPIQERII